MSIVVEPRWRQCIRRVQEVVPGCARLVVDPASLSPDAVWEAAASDASLDVRSAVFPNLRLGEDHSADPFDLWPEERVLREVFALMPPAPGPLWLTSSRCVHEGIPPWEGQGEDLEPLLDELSGWLHLDTFFVWKETPRVSLIHHSGACAHILPKTK